MLLFQELSTYIQHISESSSGIYLLSSSHRKEKFTFGNCGDFQSVSNKIKYANKSKNKNKNNKNLLLSILISDLSIYIQNIPEISSSIYLTYGSGKREFFTCGEHINLRIIKDATIHTNKNGCIKCATQITDNTNLLSISILFTNLSTYIQHISKLTSGLYLSKSSNTNEFFTCGSHIKSQIISCKMRKFNNVCKQCFE